MVQPSAKGSEIVKPLVRSRNHIDVELASSTSRGGCDSLFDLTTFT